MPPVVAPVVPRGTRTYAWAIAVGLLLVGTWLSASPPRSATAASITVTANIVSQTSVDLTACASPAALSFGTVQPGTPMSTNGDCTVAFGSTNSVASLQLSQLDGAGGAMYRPTTGVLDPAFGTAGRSSHSLGTVDQVWGSAVAPDESTLLVMSKSDGANNGDLHLIRIGPSGSLDSTFNGGLGYLRLPLKAVAGTTRGVAAVTILANGQILVGGSGSADNGIAAARVNANGTLDTPFGGGDGVATMDPGGFANTSLAYRILALRSGKFALIGFGNTPTAIALVARYNADGTPDMTFGGGDAYYELDLSGTTGQSFITGQELADGRLLIGGGSVNNTGAFTLLRLTADGTLDTSFGTAGIWRPNYGTGGFWDDMEIEASGTILLHGTSIPSFSTRIARLAADGSGLVTTLAGTGLITTTPVVGSQSGHSIGLDDDGSIMVGGSTATSNGDSVVRRYYADGTLDTSFGTAGTGTYVVATGADEVTSVHPLPNGGWRLVGNAATGAAADAWVGSFTRTTVPDYDDTANDDWGTAGAAFFGACLRATSAVADWSPNATCAMSDGAHWAKVRTTPTTVAHMGGFGSGTASLRFGLRTATSLAPGRLMAPVRVGVIAP